MGAEFSLSNYQEAVAFDLRKRAANDAHHGDFVSLDAQNMVALVTGATIALGIVGVTVLLP